MVHDCDGEDSKISRKSNESVTFSRQQRLDNAQRQANTLRSDQPLQPQDTQQHHCPTIEILSVVPPSSTQQLSRLPFFCSDCVNRPRSRCIRRHA